MSRSQINLQDAFLNHVRKEKIPVSINLAGGGKIDGLVKGFDNFVILLKHEGQHLIYKHAINTIVPERPVELVSHSATGEAGAEHVADVSHGTKPTAIETKPAGTTAPMISPDHEAPEIGDGPSSVPDESEPWVEG